MIIAIHQPNYIPWLGYFYKLARAERFVFLDMVPCPDASFVNRNSIKTPNGAALLTIPVFKSGRSGQLINQVETDNAKKWSSRHLKILQFNYGRAPFFREVFARLEPHYRLRGDRSNLAQFNMRVIGEIASYLKIQTPTFCASALGVSGTKVNLNLDICKLLGATAYLAGLGAKNYQDDEPFRDAGIDPRYSPFRQEEYPQLFGDFISNLSILDVVMNCGSAGTRRLMGLPELVDEDQRPDPGLSLASTGYA